MKNLAVFKWIFIPLALLATERFCRSQTEGFCLNKAVQNRIYPTSFVLGTTPQNLDQPFYFLGSGVQSYAFIGRDQETIIKFFKHHHAGLCSDTLEAVFPKSWVQNTLTKRDKRMNYIFSSAAIAYEELPEETGVVYAHLGKTDKLLGSLTLYDKIGVRHTLDLNKAEFIVQKRVQIASERLHTLFQNGKTEEAIQSMKHLLFLIEKRSRQGIKNKDGNILENCGFLEKAPKEFDVGSFIHRVESDKPDPHKKAVFRAAMHMLGFVKKYYPQHLGKCREELLHENCM